MKALGRNVVFKKKGEKVIIAMQSEPLRSDRQTDRRTKYCNPLAHARRRLIIIIIIIIMAVTQRAYAQYIY